MRPLMERSVDVVISLAEELESIAYIPRRKATFSEMVETLDGEDIHALEFFLWFSLFNSKFKAIAPDRYYYLPVAVENTATIEDFIKLIRTYEGISISPSREIPLIKFLSKCDARHRRFYFKVMSKDFAKVFPMLEVQTKLNLDSITTDDVYAKLKPIGETLGDLEYPLGIRSIPTGKLSMYAVCKEPNKITAYNSVDSKLVKTAVHHGMRMDTTISSTPRYSIAGMFGHGRMYPFDFYHTEQALVNCDEDYHSRLIELNYHVGKSINAHTSNEFVRPVVGGEGLSWAIEQSVQKVEHSTLLVTDGNSFRTGDAYYIPIRVTSGNVESVMEGSIPSVAVWFNGRLTQCTVPANDSTKALIANLGVLVGQQIDFYHYSILGQEYLLLKGVLWGKRKWKKKPIGKVWVRGCILCGREVIPHSWNGICCSCESGLSYYYKKHGADTPIPPSPNMQRNRWETVWKPELLNVAEYKYKGKFLFANEDGTWMFKNKESIDG